MLRRRTYYALADGFSDDFAGNTVPVVESFSTIVEDATRYLTVHREEMFYPGKSYAIALCYAHWLSQLGAGGMLGILSDPSLLNGDDPYFVPLGDAHIDDIYIKIIESTELPDLFDDLSHLPYLEMTRNYFMDEFLLGTDSLVSYPLILGADAQFKWKGDIERTKYDLRKVTSAKNVRVEVYGGFYTVIVPETTIYDVNLE